MSLSCKYLVYLGIYPTTHAKIIGKFVLSKQTLGIAAAVWIGLMAGSSLIPLHYAKKHGFGGANYMISYATGALMANTALWILYFLALLWHIRSKHRELSWEARIFHAAERMPEWHIQQLWKPGLVAGE
jgi:hypothetical protein